MRAIRGWTSISLAVLSAIVLTACVPSHSIRPYPSFIQAGVAPGDRVEIVTSDGRELAFTVERVSVTGLAGGGHEVAYGDIKSIARRGWTEPALACGGSRPVGCSVPLEAQLVSEFYAEYARRFRPACIQHDFCYRHGHVTYGLDQAACDGEFRRAMLAECSPDLSLTGVLKVESVADCQLAAEQMAQAVQRFGKRHFLTATSTYCEYDGPP